MDDLFIIKGEGPILITGPHSVYTIRNKHEIHDKEQYINEIIKKIYNSLGPKMCTIMIWNEKIIKKNNLYPSDPNFVKDIEKSIWFKKLKEFKLKKPKFYLHLDIHGMKNKSTPNDIEIGMKAINLYRPGLSQHMKPIIKDALDELNTKYSFNSKFQGFGINKYTISEKGAILDFLVLNRTIKFIRKKMIKIINILIT